MQIVIQARGFDLSAGLREHVERRLHFALDWAQYHVSRIVVSLSDIHGPRGGEDKRCQIRVAMDGAPEVAIDDTESDLYLAIDRAVDRVGRTLSRRLARQREHRHDRLGVARSAPEAAAEIMVSAPSGV